MQLIKLLKFLRIVWIVGWSLILYHNLFQAFNIWGLVYPLLSIVEELIFCLDNDYSILILLIINLIRWLQNITIAFLVLTGIFLFLFLLADVHGVLHTHTDDYFCTIDGICDNDLLNKQIGIIVKACLLTIIDFIWVRPITHKLMITLARF